MCNLPLQAVSGIRTVEDLIARLHSGAPDRVYDFSGRTLHLTSNWKAESDMYSAEWDCEVTACVQLSQGGGVVSNVTLALGGAGDAHVLSLCGSSRVEFRNVTFRGEFT